MAKFEHYAEPDDIEHNDISIKVAYASDPYIFIGGKSTENGNTSISVFDKPENVKSNKSLLDYVDNLTPNDFQTKTLGQITLGSDSDYNAVIERAQNELEQGFSLKYAIRISALSQFPEYQDIQEAHEIAINGEETNRVLRSKNSHNKVTFTPPPAQISNDFDLSM